MGRRLLLIALATALVPSAFAADSATRTSFANGTWNGSGRLRQVIQGAAINGTTTFSMRVRAGRVTGTMSMIGTAKGELSGAPVTVEVSGRYPMSGSARAPVARGTLKLSAVVKGKRQAGSGPVVVTVAGLRGTCDRMTGRVVVGAGGSAAAGSNTISAPFTATRVSGSGPRC